ERFQIAESPLQGRCVSPLVSGKAAETCFVAVRVQHRWQQPVREIAAMFVRASWKQAVVASIVSAATVCGGLSAASAASSSKSGSLKGKQVTFVTGVTNTFSQCLIGGLEKGFKGTGAKLVTLEAQLSPEKQQSAVEDAIAAKSSAA